MTENISKVNIKSSKDNSSRAVPIGVAADDVSYHGLPLTEHLDSIDKAITDLENTYAEKTITTYAMQCWKHVASGTVGASQVTVPEGQPYTHELRFNDISGSEMFFMGVTSAANMNELADSSAYLSLLAEWDDTNTEVLFENYNWVPAIESGQKYVFISVKRMGLYAFQIIGAQKIGSEYVKMFDYIVPALNYQSKFTLILRANDAWLTDNIDFTLDVLQAANPDTQE